MFYVIGVNLTLFRTIFDKFIYSFENRDYILMEKNKHNSLTYCKISNRHNEQAKIQKQGQIKPRPLGGISLYNEQYKRHIQNREDHQESQQRIDKPQTNYNNSIYSKQFDQLYFEQMRINQVRNYQSAEPHKQHSMAEQIQKIISDLRRSQLNTANLIEEIKRNSETQEIGRFSSFQEIFQMCNKQNITKLSTIMQKIEQQLRRRFTELFKRVKNEQLQKIRNKGIKMVVDQSVQTHVDYLTQNLQDIQKQLEKQLDLKKVQYDALFHHNTQTLIDLNQTSLEQEQTLNKQKVFIKHLQIQIKQKAIQMKKLQNQLKNVQDSLLKKLIQRKSNLSELKSIEEDEPDDASEENRISATLKRRFRKKIQKRRAESVIVLKNDAHNKLKEFISLVTDLQSFKSKSMKQIDLHILQKEREKSVGNRVSIFEIRDQKRKTSKNKRVEVKQTDRYKNKSELSKRTNHVSNQIVRNKKFDFYQKKLARKSQSKLYVEMERIYEKRQTQITHKNRFTAKRASRPSFESNFAFKANNTIKNFEQQRNSFEMKDEIINTDMVVFKSGNISDKQSKKTQILSHDTKPLQKVAKVFKEVSFHLKHDNTFDLKIWSHEVSVCIGNEENAKMIPTKSEDYFNYKANTLNSPKKQKNEQLKPTKSKLTKKTHFKAVSELPSFNRQYNRRQEPFSWKKEEQVNFQPYSKQNIFPPSQQEYYSLNTTTNSKQKQSIFQPKKNTFYNSKYFQNKVKLIAAKCAHKDQFVRQLSKIHQGCGQNCDHLKKYLQSFQKIKSKSLRSAFKLKVQDLNSHIKQNQPHSKVSA